MASWVFSSIQSISSKVLEAIQGTAAGPPDVADQNGSVIADLQKLSRMLARIMAVQQDAEEREIHDRSVRLWLEELRGVAYQAEDVLDEYHYEVLRSIVESGDAAIEMYHQEDRDTRIKRKFAGMYISSSLSYSSASIAKISIPDGMGEKIKSITERFEEISNDRQALHLKEDEGFRLITSPQIRPPTSSHVDERALFGREEEKEKIISLLTSLSCPNFMVLPIIGMGGLGKTTLAQLVYNDSRIHQLFNKRSWVSVSDDFDLVRLTKAIIESMSDSPCGFSELSKLQDVLKDEINGISLFLVLDDVWNEKINLWECFQGGFVSAKTVRILMTTRNSTVAEVMQTTSPFHLGYLPEEYCWSLFKHFAFGNREAREDANLLEIGRGIVGKCKGLPLAIKELPENMENLVNLQYLELCSIKIKRLPESISQLRKLHILSLKWCCELKELPRSIEQLTELQILDLPTVNMPYGIEKLKIFKPLTGHFNVMDHGMMGGLGVLKDINELSGLLCISGLKNIGDADCSSKANLASKPNLNKLFLDFEEADHVDCDHQETFKQYDQASSRFGKHLDALHLSVISSNVTKNENVEKKQEGVLESLRPCGTITELKILHYRGKKFPSWLINLLVPKLTTVTIDCCSEPHSLPPFGQLAYLRVLSISGGSAISVGDEPNTYLVSPKQPTYLLLGNGGTGVSFRSLQVLLLRNMLYLEWQTREGDFPCLKKLNIENCPQLGKIAAIPREVRELVIRDSGCHEIQFPLESKIQDILISGCGELILVRFMGGDLPNLENIFISNCQELISISWSNVNSTGDVTFDYCPKLKLLTIPSGIKKLKISYCDIQSIFFSFQSNIRKVDISHCPTLPSICWAKTSFHTELLSNDCPKLKKGLENLQMSYCSILHFTVKSVSHSITKRTDIYDCPRMDLGIIYVYQKDTVVKELNAESLEVESLTCPPLFHPSCQWTMLDMSSLVTLEISNWSKVISVTGLDNLSKLVFLSISGCPELCDWNDRGLPVALKFLELESCDKLQSLPLLSVENQASSLKVLVIINCPKLSVLEGFHGLMNLRTVELRRCRSISISPATESLNFRPHVTISDCPLLRDWCQRNSITYYKLEEVATEAILTMYIVSSRIQRQKRG
ncbi:hypothetical protein LUZ61_000120 [Rhynchospora tenuis]|uniref:Uncharacterized protein n=1 Tax=Rhynchospora tenuis TaxID=198213 RepID=A0AAD6EPR4_9POAL|nr:hypothetical protein LUZ61_000120 [Rhynchospora tenuis]